MVWYGERSEAPPYKSSPPSILGPPVIQAYTVPPFNLTICDLIGTFTFDQSYKQTESKIQVILCKQKKQMAYREPTHCIFNKY